MDQQTKSIEIVNYVDYVPFINDLVDFKRSQGQFSFRSFCKKSGFKSPTYLKWVMDQKRPISPKSVDRFAMGLDLGKRETRYLQLLVNFKEAKDKNKKKFFFEEILERQKKNQEDLFDKDKYDFLSSWYMESILCLVNHPEFSEDPLWIQKKLVGTLTIWDIKNSLRLLEKLALVTRDEQAKLKPTFKKVDVGIQISEMASFNYQSEVLKVTKDQLAKLPHEFSHLISHQVLMDGKGFEELKNRINTFSKEMSEFINHYKPDLKEITKNSNLEVYSLNIQLTPMSQIHILEDESLDED